MPKLSEDELLRLACIYAVQDRESFVDAYSKMPNDPAAKSAASYLRQLEAYRRKRWGKSSRDKIGEAKIVSVTSDS